MFEPLNVALPRSGIPLAPPRRVDIRREPCYNIVGSGVFAAAEAKRVVIRSPAENGAAKFPIHNFRRK